MADKYYITGDINTTNKNYGEKRVEIGGSGGGSILKLTLDTSGDFPKMTEKAGVIWEALNSGTNVFVEMEGVITPVMSAGYFEGDGYMFVMAYWEGNTLKKADYYAVSADDYPEIPQT